MDLALRHPVSLFLAWISVVTAIVEPPANVTLHCHNLTSILVWDYNQLTPGIRFRVSLLQYNGIVHELWVEPPDLQADLSLVSNHTEEYLITVTAVMGENESYPSPSEDGIAFTYREDSVAPQKCFVDLPSVTVTAQPDHQVQFSFEHPWLFYKQKLQDGGKSRKRKSYDVQTSDQLPVFTYNVMLINQGKPSHRYTCEHSVCTKTLPVDAAKKEHCLKINGELKHMSVKSKQEYCAVALPIEKPSSHC